ncbi:MAG: GDP-mannose 4,6-dehydratase [Acidobacteriota bacterium]
MTVLITGAGGFVGRHVARYLAADGVRVVGTCWPEPPDLPEVELLAADVLDAAAVKAAVRHARPETVLHLAGLSHVGESWSRPGAYFRVNVAGTENVLRAARGARIVVASSAEVYGAVPEAEQPIREDRPPEPGTPYGLTKAAAERLAFALAGEAAVVVRSFNLIGPGQARRFALPSFAAQLAAIRRGEAEPVLRVGNLSARRDFVHVEAAARAYALLASGKSPGGTYNLASGRALSVAEALDTLVRISGVEARIEKDRDRFRPVDQPLLVGDPSRLRALGWGPEPGAEAAIEALWREALAS